MIELMLAALVFAPNSTEVVIAEGAPSSLRFAAVEATNFFSRVLGAETPIVNAPTGSRASLVLGDNKWSRAAGLDVSSLKRDGYFIKNDGNRVYIAGKDGENYDLFNEIAGGNFAGLVGNKREHAAVFGVYDFFERFAGCRFYFPGEIGTVLPRAKEIAVGDIDIKREPSFTSRNPYFGGDGVWYEGDLSLNNYRNPRKVLDWIRLRLETEHIDCCHGQRSMEIAERYCKDHPEYSQLRKDGKRNFEVTFKEEYWTRQLCQSSAIWDVIYEESMEKFRTKGLRVVDVMPQDAMNQCYCEKCQAAYDLGRKHYATKLVWGKTAELARKMKAAGYDGLVTQMAYTPYGDVPDFDLPDNILVIVAQSGPWTSWNAELFQRQIDTFRAWSEKTHRRVQTWTYPHKWGESNIPGIPCMAPKSFGRYWKSVAPYVSGGFLESECERSIMQYLNYYVFSRIAWDPDVDVNALIIDHHRKMFGAGAKPMAKVYDILEEKWIRGIAGNVVDTDLGPQTKVPPVYDIWTKIYTPEVIAELKRLFAEAIAAAEGDEDSIRRIKFIGRQLFQPLAEESRKYMDAISVERGKKEHEAPSRSVVSGGEMETLSGWKLDPVPDGASIELDRREKMEGGSSVRIGCGKYVDRCAVTKYFADPVFKPNTKYRISFFMKLEGVESSSGGVYAELFDGHTWIFFPNPSMKGSVDWVYQSYDFKTSAEFDAGSQQYFHFIMIRGLGTAWFDDLRIEEIE